MSEPEILVNITFRLPNHDRTALADHIAPVIHEAIRAGGIGTTISVQPWDPDEEHA